MKHIAICADDFGMHAAVNEGALELAHAGRLSALSCMVDGTAWPDGARHAIHAPVDLGLHLDLTEPLPRHWRMGWPQLVLRAYAGALNRQALQAEIARQLDAFEHAAGAPPGFVDGHRHVHQLPVVRDVLVAELHRRYARPPWLRCCVPPPGLHEIKPWVVAALGARGLSQAVQRHGMTQSRGLLGVYAFDADEAEYLQRLRRWLALAREGDVLMCHPAMPHRGDPIATARAVEHRVLSGPAFTQALANTGVALTRPSAGTAA